MSDQFENFDRSFNRMTKFFWVFFIIVFLIIIATWVGYGVIGYKLLQAGPEGIGNAIGQVVKGIKEGAQQ